MPTDEPLPYEILPLGERQSLLAKLDRAVDKIDRLTKENNKLRDALAKACSKLSSVDAAQIIAMVDD